MGKFTRQGRPANIQKTSHKSNALGYQKRRSQKPSKASADLTDVYEYAPSAKVRRSKVGLELDRDEAGARYNDEDDDGDFEGTGFGRKELKARMLGEFVDNEQVASEDDEEIESDDAFDEEDEERFAGMGFRQKGGKKNATKRKTPKQVEIDLNEDDDQAMEDAEADEDGEDDNDDEELSEDGSGEFMDILDVFDGKADAEDDQLAPLPKSKPPAKSSHDASLRSSEDEQFASDAVVSEEGSDDEDIVEEDEDASVISASDAEDEPSALADLETFVSGLDTSDSKKRKAAPADAGDDAPATQRRRILAERTEAGPEGEFRVNSGTAKLNLDDLLMPLASGSSSSALVDLKKSTKLLQPSTSSKAVRTLAAPLPQRTQERLDREAAYEQTKGEVDKWNATMKRIKEAEHLSFPLQAEPESRPSNLELAAKFKPTTALEKSTSALLSSAALLDDQLPATEALQMSHLTVEEVKARRAELAKMRELAFRAEAKAKRLKKIKSKTFRKIRKRQRARLDAAGQDEDEEEDEEAQLEAERERARERATLRHSNTGKWAKAIKGKEGLDVDQRREITDMLDRGEKLRRKIEGERDPGESSEDESDEEDNDDDEEGARRRAFDEIEALSKAEADDVDPEKLGKGVFGMKFMRDAAERRERETRKDADDFVQLLDDGAASGSGSGSDEDDEEGGGQHQGKAFVQRTAGGGRMSFRPTESSDLAQIRTFGLVPATSASDTSSVTLQSTDLPRNNSPILSRPTAVSSSATTAAATPASLIPSTSPRISNSPPPVSKKAQPNPWLTRNSGHSKDGLKKKKSEVLVHKDSSALDKAASRLRKKKGAQDGEGELDDRKLDIEIGATLVLPTESSKGEGKSRDAGECEDADSDANSEADEQERQLAERRAERGAGGKGVKAFEQRDLVAQAFAGDNVVQAFEEAKRKEIELDAPKTLDTTLPGWGSWGGTGFAPRAPNPKFLKHIPGIAPSQRTDAGKKHVIVSEKRDKKAAKYLIKELPHPYTSHAQFDKSMAQPVGKEWNTVGAFQRGTLPKVVKKMGTVIDPLEKLF